MSRKTPRRRRSFRDQVLAFFGAATKGEEDAVRLLGIYQQLYRRARFCLDGFLVDVVDLERRDGFVLVPVARVDRLLVGHHGPDHPLTKRFRAATRAP
jgi:hypothetical protein